MGGIIVSKYEAINRVNRLNKKEAKMKYIWQSKSWPEFKWDRAAMLRPLAGARFLQGRLLGRAEKIGLRLGKEARANVLTEEAIKTAAIEGEVLNPDMVRSSIARHLGLRTAGLINPTRAVDGLVDVIMDATQKYGKPLTAGRLKSWHAALFPTGYSGLHKISAGKWRGNEPMRVVSGPIGRETVHFEAPPGGAVGSEMKTFLKWWEESREKTDGILRSALAHFYFVAVHPFEDGNGRIARALTDMALAQDEKCGDRYYSISSQIMEERKEYYAVLEKNSRQTDADVTGWLLWFLECYGRAMAKSDKIIGHVLLKADFWREHAQTGFNEKQKKALNKMLDAGPGGFEGGLTTRKYAGMNKVSRATAFREISDMVEKKALRRLPGKGRNVNYEIVWPGEK